MSVQLYDTILKNTTSSGITISDLSGLYIPASGTRDITDLFPFQRLIYSLDLEALVISSGIVVNIEGYDLEPERAQTFLSHHDATHIQGIPIGPGTAHPAARGALTTASGNLMVRYNSDEDRIELDNVDFLDLADTPDSYAGYGNYIVHVNAEATGLDFSDMGEHNLLFGNNFVYVQDVTESSTSSTTFVEKLTLTRTVSGGVYRVGWYFEWDMSSEQALFFARVQMNEVDISNVAATAAAPGSSWTPSSGFYYAALASGTLQLDIDFRSEVNNKTAYIRNARLEFWRTE
jgi:hypothetical protein